MIHYSETTFKCLAQTDPRKLLKIIKTEQGRDRHLGMVLTNAQLTFAAEACKDIVTSPECTINQVISALIPLFYYGAPVVIEGALLGIQKHLDDYAQVFSKQHPAMDEVYNLYVTTTSPGIKMVIEDWLGFQLVWQVGDTAYVVNDFFTARTLKEMLECVTCLMKFLIT